METTNIERRKAKDRFKKAAAAIKERLRIKMLEDIRDFWEDGRKEIAVKNLINSHYHLNYHKMSEAEALKYCEKYFGGEKTQGTLSKSDQVIAEIREKKVAEKPEEQIIDTVSDDIQFFKDHADDPAACVRKLKEMGF